MRVRLTADRGRAGWRGHWSLLLVAAIGMLPFLAALPHESPVGEQSASQAPLESAAHPPSAAAGRRLLQSSVDDITVATLSDPSPFGAGVNFTTTQIDGTNLDSFPWVFERTLPWRPLDGSYIISDSIAVLDITTLQYTARDWSRWDSWDAQVDNKCNFTVFGSVTTDPNMTVWGMGNGRPLTNVETVVVPASYGLPILSSTTVVTPAIYQQLFNLELANGFYTTAYAWFRAYADGTYDVLTLLTTSNQFSASAAMLNVSLALNENYNIYRAAKRTNITATIVAKLKKAGTDPNTVDVTTMVDNEFDALTIDFSSATMSRNQATFDWLESYLNAWIDVQCLNHTIIARADAYGPFDCYGLFRNSISYNVGYNQYAHFFDAPNVAFLYGHYMRFVSTKMLRRLRQSSYASITAQYNIYILNGMVEEHSTCQWLLRVLGFTSHAYVVLRGEEILRERGVWLPSDVYTNSSRILGNWTNSDLISWTESYLDAFIARSLEFGMTEYLSTYYGQSMDTVATAMMHAPTQHIYNQLEKLWKMFMIDLAAHFHPGSGTFSGPSSRSYDLFDGAHGKADFYDYPQYMQHLFLPYCIENHNKILWNATTVAEITSGCTDLNAVLQAASGLPQLPLYRVIWSTAQAAGLGYMPLDALLNITLGAAYRTVFEIYSAMKGQERLNFLSPYYQIGFGGEDLASIPLSINVCARLAGLPVSGSYTALVSGGTTYSHAYVRIFPEWGDTPFYRASTYDVAGNNMQTLQRLVATQYQSYMLTTSFLSGTKYLTASQAKAWNTNIVMPISVDALYADDYLLPMTPTSVVAIPPATIFTVRHGNASIVIRVLRSDRSAASNIPVATSIFQINNANTTAVYTSGVGLQEYSMVWQVDASSVLAGAGRVVIHHKHTSTTDILPNQYRVSMIWAGGITRNDREMYALQRLVRHAKFTETITLNNGWNATNQPWSGNPAGRVYQIPSNGDAIWKTNVKIGNTDLGVDRQDVYQPYQWDNAFALPVQGPLNTSPYFLNQFNRTVNGSEIFTPYFDGENGNTNPQKSAFFFKKYEKTDVLQQHLTDPITCVAGFDFPCWTWTPTVWSTCSTTCGAGTRTRTASCLNLSNNNKTATDSTLCGDALTLTQACNLGTCPTVPTAPTIVNVTATVSKQVTVNFKAPSSNGGSVITSYKVASNPATTNIAGTSSPIIMTGLTNGQSYTFTVYAINAVGTSPGSTASAIIATDSFSWVYSSYSTCSLACGGGTQSRTVTCTGSVLGAVASSRCTTAAPTDLTQSCMTQSCAWANTTWSSCSAPCSTGVRTRTVTCTNGLASATTVSTSMCSASTKPTTSESCNTQTCTWTNSSWTSCSALCSGGVRTRTANCTDGLAVATIVATSLCTASTKPTTSEACNTQSCAWTNTSWSSCSSPCSGGTHTRTVSCTDGKAVATIIATSLCTASTKPVSSEACNTQTCAWTNSSWTSCSSPCSGGTHTRTVNCTDGRAVASIVATSLCAASTKPVSSESCNTQSCAWTNSSWSSCSALCSGGTHTRTVNCTNGLAAATIVATSLCTTSTKPVSSESCNTQTCTWVSSSYGDCSAPCSGGTHTRSVNCTDGRTLTTPISSTLCSKTTMPITSEACNTQACTWVSGAYGNCSKSCGTGSQTRTVECTDGLGTSEASSVCTLAVGASPVTIQACATDACLWANGTWSTCSETCGAGTQTRSVTCIAANVTDCDSAAMPATIQACTLGACPTVPGTPVVANVTATVSQQVTLTYIPPDDGGSTILQYEIIPDPATPGFVVSAALEVTTNDTVDGTVSSVVVAGLTNGQDYTFTIIAINAIGASAASEPSSSITPDIFAWKYGSWSDCSVSCGGGTQTRIVTCYGSILGIVADASCAATTMLIDLSQACQTQACADGSSSTGTDAPVLNIETAASSEWSLTTGLKPGGGWFYVIIFSCILLVSCFAVGLFVRRRSQARKLQQQAPIVTGTEVVDTKTGLPRRLPPPLPINKEGDKQGTIADLCSPTDVMRSPTDEPRGSPSTARTAQGSPNDSAVGSPAIGSSALASPSGWGDDTRIEYSPADALHPQMIPEFGEMHLSPTARAQTQAIHVSEPGTIGASPPPPPGGRVFHYAASNVASGSGSRSGSRHGSVAGSRAASKPGSQAGSTAASRRVSPERNAQGVVRIPSNQVQIPNASTAREGVAVYVARYAEMMARRRSVEFANMEAQQVNSFYNDEPTGEQPPVHSPATQQRSIADLQAALSASPSPSSSPFAFPYPSPSPEATSEVDVALVIQEHEHE